MNRLITMPEDYRVRIITSAEFRTLLQQGWPHDFWGSGLVEYDPELMEKIFDERYANRILSPSNLEVLKTALHAEPSQWLVNGESMVFSRGLQLLDGQHRIKAGIETGRSFANFTVWGVPEEVFDSFNQGKKRSGADMLAAHGVPDASSQAAALRVYFRLDNNAMLDARLELPNRLIRAYQLQHPLMHYSIGYGRKISRFVPPALASALHYVFRQRDNTLADVMYEQLSKGTSLVARDPMYVLREFLGDRRTKDRRIKHSLDMHEHAQIAANMIHGWNALRSKRGLQVRGIRWDEDTPFPGIM